MKRGAVMSISCSGAYGDALVLPSCHNCTSQLSLDHLDQQVDALGRRHRPDLSIVQSHVGIMPDKDDRLTADRTHDLAHPRALARIFVAPMLVFVDLDDHVVRGQLEPDVGSALGTRGVEVVVVVQERRADRSTQVTTAHSYLWLRCLQLTHTNDESSRRSQYFMLPKRRFWKTKQKIGRVISMQFARIRRPNLVLAYLKSISK